MTLISETKAKRARAALELARLKAGEIQVFDEAVERLDPAQRALALREAARRLRQAEERLIELQSVAEALAQLETAGAYRAVVVEMCPANAMRGPAAYVGLVGQPTQIFAGFLPKVDPADLSPGDEVEVVRSGPDSFAVRSRLGRHVHFGAVARVDQVEGSDLLRVMLGTEYYYLRPSAALASEIESCDEETDVLGRFVSFEPQLGMAFAFFGEPERESLVLREFPSVKREEVVLLPDAERVIETEVLLPVNNPELAAAYGIEPAHFLLFSGSPGVGKTHTARWIATQLGRPVYLISGAEIADMWYGGTEAKLRARLEAARKEPDGAVVVWDEADAMLVERGSSMVGVENRVVSQVLTFTDGFEPTDDVLVVLTTNRPDLMDSALLRALRATPVPFRRPDAPRTRQLFELYLRDKPCADIDAEQLAREATRAVFADREPLADLVLRNSSRVPVTRSSAVSGALVRAACEGAQRMAFVRQARAGGRGRARGILRDDLFAALDEQFARITEHLTRDNVGMALTLPPDVEGNVVAVERQRLSERNRFLLDPEPQPRLPQAAAAS